MKQPMISILIPNYNGKYFLEKCLPSIFNSIYENFEVIIIDNNSSDDSVNFIKNNFPQVKLILNNENFGYSQGMNIGVEKATGDYFLFLDYDTTVDKYWLDELVKIMMNNPNIGLCASQVIDNTGDKTLYVHGGIIDRYGFFAPKVSYSLNKSNKVEEIDYGVTSWLVSRNAFFEAGKFDSDYRFFCDDTDLSWRIKLSGYKCLYAPKSIIYHYKIKKDQKKSSFTWLCRKRFIYERDYLITMLKNLETKTLIETLPLYFLYKLFIFPLNLIALDFTFFSGFLGIISALHNYKKQQKLFKNRKISDKELFKNRNYRLSPFKIRVSPVVLNNPFK